MEATIDGWQTGSFGDYAVVSFNGNKIMNESMGGYLRESGVPGALKMHLDISMGR